MIKVTGPDLLDDVLLYGAPAAIAQCVSHRLLGRDPSLPQSWLELIIRYAAGSGIIAGTLTLYAWRRPAASATEAALVHWGVLISCGATVVYLHLQDYLAERKAERDAARELDARYAREDRRVASSPPRSPARPPISLPIRDRG